MKWQDDPGLVTWLLDRQYERQTAKGVDPYLSGGVVIYMFEAYNEGFNYGFQQGRETAESGAD